MTDLTPEMCRAGRALARLDQKGLSESSGVPLPTIKAFETVRSVDGKPSRRLTAMNNRALVEAFEKAGLEFIPENGGGAGIRFLARKDTKPDEGLRPDQLTTENDGGSQG